MAKSKRIKSTKSVNVDQQLDSLGSNDEIIKKAKALQPNNSMRIVQKREVDRNLRPELGVSYGFVNGGDSYLETRQLGINFDFHLTPRWSLGLRYTDNRNGLTSEGQRVFDVASAKQAQGQTDYVVPAVDFPLQSYMAVVNWYPIYGKVSWFESAVSQFDFYITAGGGQVELNSGNSPIFTGGIGMGMWVNSWLTSRVEVRYQNYQDRVFTGERNIDAVVMQFGIGFML
jgi:outer membrane beta-barrel protein